MPRHWPLWRARTVSELHAVAGAGPGNTEHPSTVLSGDGRVLRARRVVLEGNARPHGGLVTAVLSTEYIQGEDYPFTEADPGSG